MNFSNFMIDKLTETGSLLTMGNQKSSSNPFLFSDIIKVCEQENEASFTQVSDLSNLDQTKEVFSASENVVNIKENDFANLAKQMSELFNADPEIEPSETNHKVENANITKLQFVVSEEKLIELASDFEEKTGYSIIPISNLSEAVFNAKQFTVSYKNELNKISIAISQIQVDETYTNKVIEDDYNFVNKLLFNEGFINNQSFKKIDSSTTKADDIIVLANTSDEEMVSDTSSNKVFYKAEIIKIESQLKTAENSFPLIVNNNKTNLGFSTPVIQTMQDGKQETENTKNIVNVYNKTINVEEEAANPIYGLTDLLNTKRNSTELLSSIGSSESSIKPSVATIANSSASATEGKLVDKTETELAENSFVNKESLLVKTSNDNNVKYDINTLIDGLTEEEKSVFKSFKNNSEIKEIVYAKTKEHNNENSVNPTNINSETIKSSYKPSNYEVLTEPNLASVKEKTSDTFYEEKEKLKNTKEYLFEVFSDSKLQLSTKPKTAFVLEASLEKNTEVKNDLQNMHSVTNNKESVINTLIKDVELELNETIEQESGKTKLSHIEAQNNLTDAKEKQKTTEEVKQSISAEKTFVKDNKIAFRETHENNGSLFSKITYEKQNHFDINNEKHTNSLDVKPTNQNEVVQTEVKVASSGTANQNGSEATFASVFGKEINSPSRKEMSSSHKNETEVKESVNVETKNVKVDAEQQQYGQNEKESSKSNTTEIFKSHLNQTISTEKSFELDSLKPQAETKNTTESFKSIKQQEIIPELSKMVLHGEKKTMTLQLTPENLGKVKLTVDMVDNQIVTKIEVENEQVKQFVQSNLDQLKQNMQSAGITLANVNVSLSDEQKNQKMFTQKKKSLSREGKEEIIDEVTQLNSKKRMGYNTYEFTA